MGFEGKVTRTTLLEKLAERIEQRIHDGSLAAGDRMPPEGVLAQEYGVSRPLVREALAKLRARGYVETVNGLGTFVRHPDASDLADALFQQVALSAARPLTVEDLYEARTAIEGLAVKLAAQRESAPLGEELTGYIEDMKANLDNPTAYTTADVGFHLAIARASGNPLLPTLLAPLAKIIVAGVFESAANPTAANAGIREHTRIATCVGKGDARAAVRAMEAHLASSVTFFPRGVLSAT